MSIKVVIIGSNGMLGQSLVNRLEEQDPYQIFAMASGVNRNSAKQTSNYFNIDITDFKTIKWQLALIEPDVIINALAMTNVDICEVEKELCDKVNANFTADLAQISKELKAHFIHISTDFIFDGSKGLYTEDDTPNPVNYYGLSKWKAEQKIQEIGGEFSILRTILVYGKLANMKRNNIVLWVKQSLEKGETIKIVNDQYRMPTYVGSIVDACVLIMEQKATGVFNISGSEFLSIYEMALQVAKFYNLEERLIQATDSNTFVQKAKRPPKTGFVLEKAINELGFKPLSLQEGLLRMQRHF